MGEKCGNGNRETEIALIGKRLADSENRRQLLIGNIYESVNKISPIMDEPAPQEAAPEEKIKGGFVGEINSYIKTMNNDNDRLSLIKETLDRIV